ncbi:hypothetical protein HDA43_006617 [Streptosporangium sandarakinum]|uniref:Uncharacterized protein n=1 Tax=Streptosporangium sandarakinum TaxID=1260955 RepID=A0A852V8I4_9ACTN|nr:hypothetical protein [Streptosporangium sandarakinum]
MNNITRSYPPQPNFHVEPARGRRCLDRGESERSE